MNTIFNIPKQIAYSNQTVLLSIFTLIIYFKIYVWKNNSCLVHYFWLKTAITWKSVNLLYFFWVIAIRAVALLYHNWKTKLQLVKINWWNNNCLKHLMQVNVIYHLHLGQILQQVYVLNNLHFIQII